MKRLKMNIQNILSKKLLSIIVLFISTQTLFSQNVVRYDLYVRDTIVNFSGKQKHAIAVNGQIPMPTLTFTEGDIAEIYVHNELMKKHLCTGMVCSYQIKKMVSLI